LTAFLISDRLNSPTSYLRTTLEPSRVFWNLKREDFDSPLRRLKMTVVSAQWEDSVFPSGDLSPRKELSEFVQRITHREFSPLVLLFALPGLFAMLRTRRTSGLFYVLCFSFSLLFVLNYRVSDKNVFYLSLYIPLSIAMGAGMGAALEWVHRQLTAVPTRFDRLLYVLPVLFFVTAVLTPTAPERWRALRDGAASFVADHYAYPVGDLEEPRSVARMRLAGRPDNAVYVLDWRALFTTAYLAHVERDMTNTLFFEALPYGNRGKVASTLVDQLAGYLHEGRPVFADRRYPGLEGVFRLVPASGDLYRASLPR
jgi:hypothetical protein